MLGPVGRIQHGERPLEKCLGLDEPLLGAVNRRQSAHRLRQAVVIRPEYLGFLERHLKIFLGVRLIAVLDRPGRPRLYIKYLEQIQFDENLPRRFSSNRIRCSN